MQKLRNQNGIAVVEIILSILLIVAIGAAGYFAYQDHTKSTSSQQPTKVATPTTPGTGNNAAAQQSEIAAAKKVVQNFYAAYIQAAQNGPQSAYTAVVAQYGTQNFITTYPKANDFDPVFCGQNMPDQGISVVSATANSTSNVTVNITQNYSSGGSPSTSATVISGKIDSVNCPATQ